VPGVNSLERWFRALPLVRWVRRRKRASAADVYLLSFPKVGRTWVRVLLGKLLAEHYGHAELAEGELGERTPRFPGVPRIAVKHDDSPHRATAAEIDADRSEYAGTRVILMIRDLRDAAVSNYFQVTRREGSFQGDLSEWLRAPRGSVASMLRYYAVWARQRHVPQAFMLLRYEDLRADPHRELRRVAEFIGLRDVSAESIARAVEFASFANMRAREAGRPADGTPLAAGRQGDPESFKTRRGKVGGHADYLSAADAAWLESRIRAELDPYYGY
jgi:hypothetical protein